MNNKESIKKQVISLEIVRGDLMALVNKVSQFGGEIKSIEYKIEEVNKQIKKLKKKLL